MPIDRAIAPWIRGGVPACLIKTGSLIPPLIVMRATAAKAGALPAIDRSSANCDTPGDHDDDFSSFDHGRRCSGDRLLLPPRGWDELTRA
jgi:hypothetical protein